MTPETWEEIENNPTYLDCAEMHRIVDDVSTYCRLVAQGDLKAALKHRRIALFCSDPGLGKTHSMRRCTRAGLKIGDVNPSNKVDLCYQFWGRLQEGCHLTVFDDIELPTRSEAIIGVLKSAWQSGGEEHIILPGSHAIRSNEKRRIAGSEHDPLIPPPRFPWTLGHLRYSNEPLHTREGRAEHKCHPQFEALIDRGLAPMWIDSDPRNVCFYTTWMILRGDLYRYLGLSLPQADETFIFFRDTAIAGHPRPNLRLALDLARAVRRPDYRTAWASIVRRSLKAAPDEPRALTAEDFQGKGKPDLIAEFRAARERAAERKRIADAALAAARAKAEAEADVRRREKAEIAAMEEREKATEAGEDDEADPDEDVEAVVRPQPPRTRPAGPKPYTPPPGHVFPPPILDGRVLTAPSAVRGNFAPEPKPPAPEEPPPEPDPDPDPPAPAATPIPEIDQSDVESDGPDQPTIERPNVQPEPEPDSASAATIGAAITKIFTMKERTCASVAEVLRGLPIHEWNDDIRQEVAQAVSRAGDWEEHFGLAELYIQYDSALKLFATDTEVLQFDDEHDLHIVSWKDIEARMAPYIAEQRNRDEKRRQQAEGNAIVRSKLPKVRKLKAMHQHINRLRELQIELGRGMAISDQGRHGLNYIRAMKTDEPDFTACVTFNDYLSRAIERTKETRLAAHEKPDPDPDPPAAAAPPPNPEPEVKSECRALAVIVPPEDSKRS